MKYHETNHLHHAMVLSEYGMAVSFHFLSELHMSHLVLWLGIPFFALYTIMSLFQFRR